MDVASYFRRDVKPRPLGGGRYAFNHRWNESLLPEQDWLNFAKEQVKVRLASFYNLLIFLLSPVLRPVSIGRFIDRWPQEAFIANFGSGTAEIRPHVVNFDLAPYDNVNVVCDLADLPLRSDSVDAFVNISVLEHVPDPQSVVREFHRVLKPGGEGLLGVPFLAGFHASPHDYQRYTSEGLRALFQDFEILEIHASGPTSALLWALQEWLAMVLSLGSLRIYRIVLPLTWILSPLKGFDLLLRHHPCASTSSATHFVRVRKPLSSAES